MGPLKESWDSLPGLTQFGFASALLFAAVGGLFQTINGLIKEKWKLAVPLACLLTASLVTLAIYLIPPRTKLLKIDVPLSAPTPSAAPFANPTSPPPELTPPMRPSLTIVPTAGPDTSPITAAGTPSTSPTNPRQVSKPTPSLSKPATAPVASRLTSVRRAEPVHPTDSTTATPWLEMPPMSAKAVAAAKNNVDHWGTRQGLWDITGLQNETGQILQYQIYQRGQGWTPDKVPANVGRALVKNDNSEILIRFPEDPELRTYDLRIGQFRYHLPTKEDYDQIQPMYVHRDQAGKLILSFN